MTKEKTARLIPNAIQIVTEGEKVKNISTFALLRNLENLHHTDQQNWTYRHFFLKLGISNKYTLCAILDFCILTL